MNYTTFTTLEKAIPYSEAGEYRVLGQDPETLKNRIFIAIRADKQINEKIEHDTEMILLNSAKEEIYKARACELSFN